MFIRKDWTQHFHNLNSWFKSHSFSVTSSSQVQRPEKQLRNAWWEQTVLCFWQLKQRLTKGINLRLCHRVTENNKAGLRSTSDIESLPTSHFLLWFRTCSYSGHKTHCLWKQIWFTAIYHTERPVTEASVGNIINNAFFCILIVIQP